MMRPVTWMAASTSMLTLACTSDSAKLDDPTVRAAIDKALQEHAAAAVRADPRAAASVFTADVRLMEPNTPDVHGRDSVEAMMRRGWSQVTPRAVRFTTEEVYTLGSIAFEVGTYAYTVEPRGQAPVEDHGRYMGMWKRDTDGSWRLHRFIENTVLPTPAH